jgi:hypothetical protein
MQGKHSFDPRAETVISLESFVPKDHFLRQVDRALDLSFVRELTARVTPIVSVGHRLIRKYTFGCNWWRMMKPR